MPIKKNIEYKSSGATEWQSIEVVAKSPPTKSAMVRRKPANSRNPTFRAGTDNIMPQNLPNIEQERFVLGRLREIFRSSRDSPGEIRSGGSYAESLFERLDRLHGRGRR